MIDIGHCVRCNRVCPRAHRPLGVCRHCCAPAPFDPLEARIDHHFDRERETAAVSDELHETRAAS